MEAFKFSQIVINNINGKEYAIIKINSDNTLEVSLVKNGKTWGTTYTKNKDEFKGTDKNIAHYENGVLIPAQLK